MPKPTLDQQKGLVDGLKKRLAGKGEGTEAAELKQLKKKIRRAQRKHHRTVVETDRRVAMQPKKPEPKAEAKAEAKPEEKVEEKVEEKKEEAADQPES